MQRRRRENMPLGGFDLQRAVRLLAIPFIVIILIFVIVIMDKSPKAEEADADPSVSEISTDIEGDSGSSAEDGGQAGSSDSENQDQDAENGDELKKDAIPEINALMEEYCAAKVSCDAETMYRLYGKTDMTGVEELQEKMQWRAKYIDSFQNIVCYTAPGLDENSYVVYVRTDIKFRVTDTLAPNLMWCYVTKDESGNFYIVEDVSDEILKYVAQIEQTESVRLLAAQMNIELEEAVASDTKLASAYGMLRDGSDETEENLLQPATEASGEESSSSEEQSQAEGESAVLEETEQTLESNQETEAPSETGAE